MYIKSSGPGRPRTRSASEDPLRTRVKRFHRSLEICLLATRQAGAPPSESCSDDSMTAGPGRFTGVGPKRIPLRLDQLPPQCRVLCSEAGWPVLLCSFLPSCAISLWEAAVNTAEWEGPRGSTSKPAALRPLSMHTSLLHRTMPFLQ